MKNLDKIKLTPNSTIKEALQIIDAGAVKFALVVKEDNFLLGTVTDGDIRRVILNGKGLEESINNVYFKSPITVTTKSTKEEIINICTSKKIHQIPVVDEQGCVVGIKILDELLKPKKYENRVVLMVGGLGTRLRPLTDNTPKPMLEVGGKPILETIVKQFVDSGFTNITMCLGYKSNVIQDYFRDGGGFGANIDYIVEEKRMGTAGALTLLEKRLDGPFFVMNGDLLSNIDFEKMLDFHVEYNSKATMCVREYDIEVPYGVVNVANENIISIEEKPIHNFFVNAGIYLLEPDCIDLIPDNEFYDMPNLFNTLISNNDKVVSFPLREYWLDIGRICDYEKANSEYCSIFLKN
jgi:dTDP-glucose pyrophosphorylase/predicted transcriptional regulator